MANQTNVSPVVKQMTLAGQTLDIVSCHAAVVGSGAAGLAAAMHLDRLGVVPAILLTEAMNAGTSRNTGSDKQTYYKLSLAGDDKDSVDEMAQTLFAGGCMDGDLARIEAALSAGCFSRLCDLKIPFPKNEYGEAVGYKTDHDPRKRATSAGPLTSKLMTEALEKAVRASTITIYDGWQVVKILTDSEQINVEESTGQVQGLLCLNRKTSAADQPVFMLVLCQHVIWATGGPAILYADSVFPHSQRGATGLALAAGVPVKNPTEWQYGLASVKPRWNVSGSFQQVLPRYISTDEAGHDIRDFLDDYISDPEQQLGAIFRKGYEWPFDVRKINGSSMIDMLVYQETVLKGRRVFLDFRENPGCRPINFNTLDPEAASYLKKAGADQAYPIDRLKHLNQPAIAFYADHQIDLAKEPLEIRLCAQHHNGGLAGDHHWESPLPGFYPVGEANGSHGIYRPGGSALNSGQVGAERAAQAVYLACKHQSAEKAMDRRSFDVHSKTKTAQKRAIKQAERHINWLKSVCKNTGTIKADYPLIDIRKMTKKAQQRMSQFSGPFRSEAGLLQAIKHNEADLTCLHQHFYLEQNQKLSDLSYCYDLLLCEKVYLTAMLDYIQQGGGSRGSFLCLDEKGVLPAECMPSFFTSRPLDLTKTDQIQEARLVYHAENKSWQVKISWRQVRPLPKPDDVFETVWKQYRERYVE